MGKTKKLPLIEIISVLDRSGSMSSLQDEAIGAYNTFLKEQKAIPGDVKVTTVLFDDHYDVLYEDKDLKEVPDMDKDTFVPRGMTALHDAVGKTIQTVTERLNNTKKSKRPKKVIMVIVTDGAENASREYNGAKVDTLIKEKQKEDWEFIYLASDLKAFNDVAFASVSTTTKTYFAAGARGYSGPTGVPHYTNSKITDIRNSVYEHSTTDGV